MSTLEQFTKGVYFGGAIFFPSSTTYTIPVSGWYRLSALGAGGSGGAIFRTVNGGAASGGSGGGFCETEVYLTAGTVLTITVGAGGVGVVSSVDGTGVNGNAGGNTSISGTGLTTMTANGGPGGTFQITNGQTATSGAGGTATGGTTVNSQGGTGGTATHTTAVVNATGGASAGSPFGAGKASGTSASTTAYGATGGASILFSSGNVSGATGGAFTGGAGTGGASANKVGVGGSSTSGVNKLGLSLPACADGIARTVGYANTSYNSLDAGFETLNDPFRHLTGGGSFGTSFPAGPGAGSDASSVSSTNAGVLGGSGGVARTNNTCTSGNALLGGGSGGAASLLTGPATSGNGGNGIVAIERIG